MAPDTFILVTRARSEPSYLCSVCKARVDSLLSLINRQLVECSSLNLVTPDIEELHTDEEGNIGGTEPSESSVAGVVFTNS